MPHSGYGAPDFTGATTSRMPPRATSSGAARTHIASDHARTMNNTTFRAAGRGSDDTAFRGTPPLSTPPISDQTGSASTAATGGTDGRSTSSFYSGAEYTRRTYQGSAPPPLVLKELPLDPFDGDIRKFPEFRNRFLEIVESQPGLEAHHKLQHLL